METYRYVNVNKCTAITDCVSENNFLVTVLILKSLLKCSIKGPSQIFEKWRKI